ncbi:MAG: pyruvate ferredoxin oxidoreductase [Candidatus Zipacnadales bacterium]
MAEQIALEGNEAVAEAMRQINPDVVAAYPITPSTEVVQIFSQFVADGKVDTEFVAVESEHSAMSACIAAALGGGRVMNVTSANGMALMWEMLYIAASLRAPVTLALVNRALSGNINIHCDHSDAMGARDAGWIQLFCENAQEAYDTMFQAVRIGEHMSVRLPVMVCYDGFLVSHSVEMVKVESDEAVRQWVGPYIPDRPLLDIHNPYTVGPLDLQDFYFEHKRGQAEAYKAVPAVIEEVGASFEAAFGRPYGLMEPYLMEDAERVIVSMGSTAGTVKDVVDARRAQGEAVGALKLRAFRPFPAAQIVEQLAGKQAVAVLDRCLSFGAAAAPLFSEITSAMYVRGAKVPCVSYVYGLGGREILPEHIEQVFTDLAAGDHDGTAPHYLGLRE